MLYKYSVFYFSKKLPRAPTYKLLVEQQKVLDIFDCRTKHVADNRLVIAEAKTRDIIHQLEWLFTGVERRAALRTDGQRPRCKEQQSQERRAHRVQFETTVQLKLLYPDII
jgi:hypothetical protein